MSSSPLLAVRRLKVHHAIRARVPWRRAGVIRAVDDIDFNLSAGETLGVVGESGCGKSTLARALVGLQKVTAGAIEYQGRNLATLSEREWRPLRRDIQMVFQDSAASLDPRMTVGRAIVEPLQALAPEMSAGERQSRMEALLERVGLSSDFAQRYPQELSGGQAQRVCIARALIVRPRILICDEPVSALDVSVQAQIVNLLRELQQEQGLAMVFIAHDLAVVRRMSQRLLVMYLGRLMEQAPREALFKQPMHPYTRALLAAVPAATPAEAAARGGRRVVDGEMPSLAAPPAGCVFATRCPMADERCTRLVPHLRRVAHGGYAACHYLGLSEAAA
jgi:oligopeptide transport system ATP-binding protein